MDEITLTTERLRLRPFTAGDADAVLAACQDEDIQRWTTVPSPYGRADAETFTGTISPQGWAKDTLYNFGLFTADGTLVGSMGLTPRGPGIAEIGFWTVREQRRRGYTAEAAAALCRWGFETLPLRRIEWLALAGNDGSRATAEKVGFRFEGSLRNREVHRGEVHDTWIASLTPQDLGYPLPPL